MAVVVVTAGCGALLSVDGDDPLPAPVGGDGGLDGGSASDARADNDGSPAEEDAAIDASCGDTSSNPDHCGACGRTCNLDGGCASGRCERFVVFVTSTTTKGGFGGTAAGDKRCTDLARAAGLGGDFRVWIGADTIDRFAPQVTAAYHLTSGVRIATKWPPAGDLEQAISFDETARQPGSPTEVWSDFYEDGGVAPMGTINNCQGWANGSNLQQGGYGSSASASEWSRAPGDRPCGSDLRLYCVEKP